TVVAQTEGGTRPETGPDEDPGRSPGPHIPQPRPAPRPASRTAARTTPAPSPGPDRPIGSSTGPRLAPPLQFRAQPLPVLDIPRPQHQAPTRPPLRPQARDHPRRAHHAQARRGPPPTAGPPLVVAMAAEGVLQVVVRLANECLRSPIRLCKFQANTR